MGSPTNVRFGAGTLYVAPEGTVEPTNTASATGFSDTWPVGWTPVGYTDEGHSFKYGTDTEEITVAEEFAPIGYIVTSVNATVEFSYAEMTAANLKLVLGGTVTTTGTGVTNMTKFEPLAAGILPDRLAIGWESSDKKERMIYRAVLPTDDSEIERRKDDKTVIPATYGLLVPANGAKMFAHYRALGA